MTTTKVRRVTTACAFAVMAASLLSGCTQGSEASGDDSSSVSLERVSGTDRYQVTLSDQAADRLGIETDTVRSVPAGTHGVAGVRSTVPYAAIVYDNDGSTWAYAVARTGTFVRRAVTVESIVGTTAFLTEGPPTGTAVVVVGAPELLGAEYQIAGEE